MNKIVPLPDKTTFTGHGPATTVERRKPITLSCTRLLPAAANILQKNVADAQFAANFEDGKSRGRHCLRPFSSVLLDVPLVIQFISNRYNEPDFCILN